LNTKTGKLTVRTLLWLVVLFTTAGPACQQSKDIFDLSRVVDVEIELAQADWDALCQEGRGLAALASGCASDFEYTYFDASVTVDGQRIEHAGVRKKGFLGSLSVVRPSLKIHFGKFVPDQTCLGMKRLTLNNDRQDPSHTHQVMSYALFRKAGIVAPSCNLARVSVNGELLGIYSNVESIKKPFLARYFSDNNGNLYEGQLADFTVELVSKFERKTNKTAPDGGPPDRSDLDRVVQALNASDADLLAELGKVIDVDEFLTFWAMEVITGHWDGYTGDRNNFYAYHDPETDLFHFIPWGTDGAFGKDHLFLPNIPSSVYAWGKIANRLYSYPETRTLYHVKLRSLLDDVWNEDDLLASVDQIEQLASADPQATQDQRKFISSRKSIVLSELYGSGPDWPYPLISEIPECKEPQEASGTFSATWGSVDNFVTNENVSLTLTLNGQPQIFEQVLNSAGIEGDQKNFDDYIATIRLLGIRSGNYPLAVILHVMESRFETGEIPLHGFETFGVVVEINQQTGSYRILNFIGDGAISLDVAGMNPGDTVSGSFSGLMAQ